MSSGFFFPVMGLCGARSRNRTGTPVLEATDFKSVVSTYFTTRAFLARRKETWRRERGF